MLAQSLSPPDGPISDIAVQGPKAETAFRFGNLALRAGMACIPIVVAIGFLTDRPSPPEPSQAWALKSTDVSDAGSDAALPAAIDLVSLRGSFAESLDRAAEATPARIKR